MQGPIANALKRGFCADEAGVTHIVKPFGAGGDPDDGIQYMRNLGVK